MSIASKCGLFLVRFYQALLSPLLGGGKCRFCPTCSEYSAEALRRYGFFLGSVLSVRRVLRCGPWTKPGYDPVPDIEEIETWILIGRIIKELRKVR